MKAWKTEVMAISPKTNELETFDGPPIYAADIEAAQNMCDRFMPYCHVVREDVDQKELVKKLFKDK